MIRRPPRSPLDRSSAASDVYKRQLYSFVQPFIERTARHRPIFIAVLPGVRRSGVSVKRRPISPRFDDRKVIRTHRVLIDVEAEISLVLAAVLRETQQHHWKLRRW